MIIEALSVTNFKGIKSIKLQGLRPGLIIVTGNNGAGKSSLLDAIEQGLRGGKAVAKKPIREGADKADVQFDLGELEVTRTWREAKAPVVKVRNKKNRTTAGQKVLDMLLNARTMDPTSFLRLDEKRRSQELQKALGLDFTEVDKKIQEKYDARTFANRDRDNARAMFDNMTRHDDAPAAEYSLLDLTGELADMNALKARVDECTRRETDARKAVEDAEADVAILEAQLQAARDCLVDANAEAGAAATEAKSQRALFEKCRSIEKIENDIENIETQNQKARDNKAYAKAAAEVERLEKDCDGLDGEVASLRRQRDTMLTEAKCPVKGMAISEEGITINSIPLEQCSQAEQLRVGFEVARLIDPELKVICCREGSNLDDEALKFLADLATSHGYQFWIEMVRTDDDHALTIVAGELGKTPAAE